MGGPPVIEWVRPGVGFTPGAAESFRRAEREWGRNIRANSTYRDYNLQLSMWRAWQAYVSGRGPHPGHSRALHPDESMHCRGEALDTPDWSAAGFISLMQRHGWIRTAASDPTEQHHFEYQSRRDQHRNDPAPAGQEDDSMSAAEVADLKKFIGEQFHNNLSYKGAGYTYPAVADDKLNALAAAVAKIAAGNIQFAPDAPYLLGPALAGVAREGGATQVQVDEAEIARTLAPLLAEQMTALSDVDVQRLATAAADEQDRRARERLTQ